MKRHRRGREGEKEEEGRKRLCVRSCVRACVCACVRACLRACVSMSHIISKLCLSSTGTSDQL